MAKMPFGSPGGGLLHGVFPPGGRYGGPSVAERNAAREVAKVASPPPERNESGLDRAPGEPPVYDGTSDSEPKNRDFGRS